MEEIQEENYDDNKTKKIIIKKSSTNLVKVDPCLLEAPVSNLPHFLDSKTNNIALNMSNAKEFIQKKSEERRNNLFNVQKKGKVTTTTEAYTESYFSSDYYTIYAPTLCRNRKSQYTVRKISDKSKIDEDFTSVTKRIVVIVFGYELNFSKFLMDISMIGFKKPECEQIQSILYVTMEEDHIIFIFSFGAAILFNFSEEKEKQISKCLFKNCNIPISFPNSLGSSEFEYKYKIGENYGINLGHITLESNEVLDKLAIAYAIGQEAMLCYYEFEVDSTINETKVIPIEMRDKGRISMTRKQINKSIGLIFMKKCLINLHSDILGVPLIFRENEEQELFYKTMRDSLDIDKRTEILNKRLIILSELYDVLNEEVKTQSMLNLEWIVVYLIMIEILVSLFWEILVRDILKLF